jgi:exodeoxyribonuclease VII small subunit
MSMTEEKMDFEKAFSELRNMAEQIKSPGLNLEESILCYEKGLEYFQICDDILKEAQQKIDTVKVTKESD